MQARPRGLPPPPSAGFRIPQVAGATRPARLPAQKLQASAAPTICIVFAPFPLVRAPSATSSPNLVARWVSRRLPLVRSKIRAYFGGYRGLGPLIAGDQPKLCRSAAGNPSSRSLRSNGRHSDGSATAPPDSAPFRTHFRAIMRSQRIRVCAAVQVAPILRIPPRKPCDVMGASPTPRTRRLHAASTWRGSRNGTSLPRAQKYPSKLAHSDGKPRVQLSSHATRAQNGLCRPIWVSLRACKLRFPCAMHTGCTRPAGSSRLASGTPPPMAPPRVAIAIVRSDRGYSPEWLPLAACSNAPDVSCISADPRALGRPWAATGALSRHGHTVQQVARLFKLSHRWAACTADWAWGMPGH